MRVLITGVTGQDGSYLADQLVYHGHTVYGAVRPESRFNLRWATGQYGNLHIATADLTNAMSIAALMDEVQPEVVFNLAAQLRPGQSAWGDSQELFAVNTMAVYHFLEYIRHYDKEIKFVHASSSAIYAPDEYGAYGASKTFAHKIVRGFREDHGVWASNVVLYSHTSSRQSNEFLARRIARHAIHSAIYGESAFKLNLTSLGSTRLWGFAPYMVQAFPAIATALDPDDYHLGGERYSIEDLVITAFEAVGIMDWESYVDITPFPDHHELVVNKHPPDALKYLVRPPNGFIEEYKDMVGMEYERELAK